MQSAQGLAMEPSQSGTDPLELTGVTLRRGKLVIRNQWSVRNREPVECKKNPKCWGQVAPVYSWELGHLLPAENTHLEIHIYIFPLSKEQK